MKYIKPRLRQINAGRIHPSAMCVDGSAASRDGDCAIGNSISFGTCSNGTQPTLQCAQGNTALDHPGGQGCLANGNVATADCFSVGNSPGQNACVIGGSVT